MTAKLYIGTVCKFLLGVVLVGVLIFLPAGTLAFFNGWLLMGVLFLPMLLVGIVMMVKAPTLLQKRLHSKEKEQDQQIVVKLSGLMFVIGFIVAGLGYRFGWFMLPIGVSVGAAVVLILSYVLYVEVLRENAYVSRTIVVQEGQKVIDTGLYGVVRHPMYGATLFMFLSIPLILGSVYALGAFLAYPLIISKRIKGEEALLERELDGYGSYKDRVRYRLIPFVW